MDKGAMTRRMVKALENPHLDILGHCTGRKLPVATDEAHSTRDATAAEQFRRRRRFRGGGGELDKALEINCRPDRLDPPSTMLRKATRVDGLLFAIDSDAHAVAQLDWLSYGCERAEAAGLEPERVVNALVGRGTARLGRLPRGLNGHHPPAAEQALGDGDAEEHDRGTDRMVPRQRLAQHQDAQQRRPPPAPDR